MIDAIEYFHKHVRAHCSGEPIIKYFFLLNERNVQNEKMTKIHVRQNLNDQRNLIHSVLFFFLSLFLVLFIFFSAK